MLTRNEIFAHVARAIARGRASWALGDVGSGRVALALGAPECVRLKGGMVVTIALDVEELRKLRDACDEALSSVPQA